MHERNWMFEQTSQNSAGCFLLLWGEWWCPETTKIRKVCRSRLSATWTPQAWLWSTKIWIQQVCNAVVQLESIPDSLKLGIVTLVYKGVERILLIPTVTEGSPSHQCFPKCLSPWSSIASWKCADGKRGTSSQSNWVPKESSMCGGHVLTMEAVLQFAQQGERRIGRRILRLSKSHSTLVTRVTLKWPSVAARILTRKLNLLSKVSHKGKLVYWLSYVRIPSSS